MYVRKICEALKGRLNYRKWNDDLIIEKMFIQFYKEIFLFDKQVHFSVNVSSLNSIKK